MRTFSERRKRPVQLEFGQFFNDLHDLNRLWTVRDLYGQTAPLPLVLRFFSFDANLRLARANLRRQRRITVQTHDGFLEVFGEDESPELIHALSALADGKEVDLFAHSPNLLFEKFHPHLTEELLQRDALREPSRFRWKPFNHCAGSAAPAAR